MQSILQYRRLRRAVEAEYSDPEKRRSASTLDDETSQSDEKDDAAYQVDFTGDDDPHCPRNWSRRYKIFCTSLIFSLTFVTGWASAADSSALQRARSRFDVSELSETLSTALYLFGVGTGGLLAGTLSELSGRNPAYFITGMLYLLAVVGSGAAQNFATQIIMRMFAGFFASPSMTIFGGSLSDIWDVDERAWVWPVFSLAPLLGPLIAPIPSGWIEQSSLTWRWVEWVTLIISGAAFLMAFLFLPETFSPMILTWKANIVRQITKNDKYVAEHETSEPLSRKLQTHAQHMLIFLTREPITILVGLYLTLLYILVFTFLHGFTYIYGHTYGWSSGLVGSSFAASCIGVLLGVPYVMLVNFIHHRRRVKQDPESVSTPESRLIPAIPVTILLPASLFWIAFTDKSYISYFSPLAASMLFGFSLTTLFTPLYHYVIDAYSTNSASAMAAITFARYYASGGMVIATIPMYDTLKVEWTMVLVGCVAALMIPVPALFWWKGKAIRKSSRFAGKDDLDDEGDDTT